MTLGWTRASAIVELTDAGRIQARQNGPTSCPALFRGERRREELVRQALSRDASLFHRDTHYLVRDEKVQIIDEFTGRILADRTWEQGLAPDGRGEGRRARYRTSRRRWPASLTSAFSAATCGWQA